MKYELFKRLTLDMSVLSLLGLAYYEYVIIELEVGILE